MSFLNRFPGAWIPLLLLVVPDSDALAQTGRGQLGGGLALTVAVPLDEFQTYAGAGVGVGAFLLWNFAEPRGLGLRLEGLLIDYGGETRDAFVNGTINQPDLRAETDHLIIAPFLGPQLSVARGNVRPYVNAGIGPAFFLTTEELKVDKSFGFGSDGLGGSTVYDDVAVAATGGAGLWIRVRDNAFLTLSAQYLATTRVSYLAEGLVRTTSNGFVEVRPVESPVHVLLLQVGVSGLLSRRD